MKKLKISGPVARRLTTRRLAEIALFEDVQERFNIHPSGLAASFYDRTKKAGKRDKNAAIKLAFDFHARTQELAKDLMDRVIRRLKNPTIDYAELNFKGNDYYIVIWFNFSDRDVVGKIKVQAENEKLDPLLVAQSLAETLPQVIHWGHSECQRILSNYNDAR